MISKHSNLSKSRLGVKFASFSLLPIGKVFRVRPVQTTSLGEVRCLLLVGRKVQGIGTYDPSSHRSSAVTSPALLLGFDVRTTVPNVWRFTYSTCEAVHGLAFCTVNLFSLHVKPRPVCES
jgi:hypothetical protein